MISRMKYRDLAAQGIKDFEILRGHPIYPDGTSLPSLHERRFIWMINALIRGLSTSGQFIPGEDGDRQDATVVSVGCFPGSLDRILKVLFEGHIQIIGVGLSISDEFRDAFLDNVYSQILAVELDPLHPGNKAAKYPTTMALADGSADAVVAGEIFEHLYSPLHFLAEVSRVLKPGGYLILTTPNVCYIGNLIKLMTGRSCYEELKTSHLYLDSEWRPHIRIYDRHELAVLCRRNGLKEELTVFLDNGEDKFYASARTRFKMRLLKLFSAVPLYRNNLCQVYCKSMSERMGDANRD